MAYSAFVPPGTIMPFGGGTIPEGWLLCDGNPVSRTSYAALFAAISTAWGSGDGSTSFHLPDLRGRFLRGRDGTAGRDPDKAGRTAANSGGNTGDNVGSVQINATAKNGLTASASTSSISGGISNSGTLSHNHGVFYTTLSGAQTQPNAGIGNTGWCAVNASLGSTVTDLSGSLAHAHGHSLSADAQTIAIGAGNNETRPINANVNYIIKT
jgi:microcystin-dependent protein